MAQKVAERTVDVQQGQYLPLPENDKLVVGGPAKVDVIRYDSGHVDIKIIDGKSVPIELALIKKWQRLSWEV